MGLLDEIKTGIGIQLKQAAHNLKRDFKVLRRKSTWTDGGRETANVEKELGISASSPNPDTGALTSAVERHTATLQERDRGLPRESAEYKLRAAARRSRGPAPDETSDVFKYRPGMPRDRRN